MRYATCEFCALKYDRQTIEQKIKISGILMFDELVKNAETNLKFPDYYRAEVIFKEITDKYPDQWRGWWGLIECKTENFNKMDVMNHINEYYKRAMMSTHATQEDNDYMKSTMNLYVNKQNELYNDRQKKSKALDEKKQLNKKRSNLYNQIYSIENKPFLLYVIPLLIILCILIWIIVSMIPTDSFIDEDIVALLIILGSGIIIVCLYLIIKKISYIKQKKIIRYKLKEVEEKINQYNNY